MEGESIHLVVAEAGKVEDEDKGSKNKKKDNGKQENAVPKPNEAAKSH